MADGTDKADGFLAGLEMADADVQRKILHHARWKHWRTPAPVVVRPHEFVESVEVKRLLRGGTHPRRLQVAGLVRDAYRASDGASGFTLESVERELRWRQDASRWARFRRATRILVGPILGWWRYPPGV